MESSWGGVDVESTEDAVFGEVFEETSIQLCRSPELLGITQCKGTSRRDHVALFYADEFKEIPNRENSFEISECQFSPLDNLPDDTEEMTKLYLSKRFPDKAEFVILLKCDVKVLCLMISVD